MFWCEIVWWKSRVRSQSTLEIPILGFGGHLGKKISLLEAICCLMAITWILTAIRHFLQAVSDAGNRVFVLIEEVGYGYNVTELIAAIREETSILQYV